MSSFNYNIVDNILIGQYENDNGLTFQAQVNVSDYDSELLAASAAQALGEEYSKTYEDNSSGQ